MFIFLMAILAGFTLLTSTSIAAISFGPGWHSPQALVIASIAGGMAVGSLLLSTKAVQVRWAAIAALAVVLICAEGFALLLTADRLIAEREKKEAPRQLAIAEQRQLQEKAKTLRTQLHHPDAAARLNAALESQRQAATTVASKAAERDCARNCRALLEQQTAAAADEVTAARAELERRQTEIRSEIARINSNLSTIPIIAEDSGLAGALGWPRWAINLLIAALGSVAANGLACVLITIGSHGVGVKMSRNVKTINDVNSSAEIKTMSTVNNFTKANRVEKVNTTKNIEIIKHPKCTEHLKEVETEEPYASARPKAQQALIEHSDQAFKRDLACMHAFIETTFQPSPKTITSIAELRGVYLVWCKEESRLPMEEKSFQRILKGIASQLNVPILESKYGPALKGVKVAA